MREELPAHFALGSGPGAAVAVEQDQTSAAQNDEREENQGQLFAIHFAAVLLRLTTERTMPGQGDQGGHGADVEDPDGGFQRVGVFAQVLLHLAQLLAIVRFGRLVFLQFRPLLRRENKLLLRAACLAGLQAR